MVFALIMTVLTCIPFSYYYTNWISAILDMAILCFNGAVVRQAIATNVTFFHKLRTAHYYEFERHFTWEFPKQLLLLISYCLLDLEGLHKVFTDGIFLGCSAWADDFGIETFTT